MRLFTPFICIPLIALLANILNLRRRWDSGDTYADAFGLTAVS